MMSSTYLDYEIALLLAKYGKNAVLRGLAKKIEMSHEALESFLREIPAKKASDRSKKAFVINDPIDQIMRDHPEKARLLRTLHGRFRNRTFLPELRDVRRFFEQHSGRFGSVKSRAESQPRLFKLLAGLGLGELDALCQEQRQTDYSSLGLISDEILRQ